MPQTSNSSKPMFKVVAETEPTVNFTEVTVRAEKEISLGFPVLSNSETLMEVPSEKLRVPDRT